MSGVSEGELFRAYFEELWGRAPFPWQARLAEQVVKEGWPTVIDLPTASGKTACIDIALFALARGRGARRIFYIVDRKVIVDEAFMRVNAIREKLECGQGGALAVVRESLRKIGGGEAALAVCELRGGMFRDESWVRSPTQPTVVASTVDQVGSRLLFRGYGLSRSSQPIHAGLIANDALLLLDEAHCSKAFSKTLDWVRRYRRPPWCEEPLETPFAFVEMTATPAVRSESAPFRLDETDRGDEVLGARLTARKRTRLVRVKARSRDAGRLAAEMIKEAKGLAKLPGIRRIAVMVNRVDTARAVASGLEGERVRLVVGRMRPVDRTRVEGELADVKSGVARNEEDGVNYTVSTQCLEVGADLDFDGLVTELASMEALLQRFGRLNRLGQMGVEAQARIVEPAEDKLEDAVYGSALEATRGWLGRLFAGAAERDFGLEGEADSIGRLWQGLDEEQRREMSSPGVVSPTLLPAHLDTLAQTSPRPTPEPAVEYFLHGKQPEAGEVNIVWRSDLSDGDSGHWIETAEACGPTVGEALAVKAYAFREWMNGESVKAQSDTEGGGEEEQRRRRGAGREVLVWRGEERFLCADARQVRVGDTVVLPGGLWPAHELGYTPEEAAADVGDQAYWQGRGAVRLRLHRAVLAGWPEKWRGKMEALIVRDDLLWDDVKAAAAACVGEGGGEGPGWLKSCLEVVARGRAREFSLEVYAGGAGWVVESKRGWQALVEDGGGDEGSKGQAVGLKEHLEAVAGEARLLAERCAGEWAVEAVGSAGLWHDTGKADERFQALLFGGDRTAAQLSPKLRAKGEYRPERERAAQWKQSGLPDGFRHEMTSLLMAESGGVEGALRDLTLHLIASHHGHARPFAPVVKDDGADDVACGGVVVSAEARQARAAYRLDSGVAERFWRLTRRYGWWGLAYLEAILRIADWRVSSGEQQRAFGEMMPAGGEGAEP